MKIYFTASHSQKPELLSYYKRIVDLINKIGHTVDAGSLFSSDNHDLMNDQDSRTEWYKSSMKSIAKADIVVVEISYPSTANVGHELSYALDKNKPVIALFKEDRDPLFLLGIDNEKLLIVPYSDSGLETVVKDAFSYATGVQDTRFNFFVAPKHQNYMDWISKNRRIPRAVFLRRLIEEAMVEEVEYES